MTVLIIKINNNKNLIVMNEVKTFYERAKQSAKNHMKNGQINDYLNDLLIMNHYKKLMDAAA